MRFAPAALLFSAFLLLFLAGPSLADTESGTAPATAAEAAPAKPSPWDYINLTGPEAKLASEPTVVAVKDGEPEKRFAPLIPPLGITLHYSFYEKSLPIKDDGGFGVGLAWRWRYLLLGLSWERIEYTVTEHNTTGIEVTPTGPVESGFSSVEKENGNIYTLDIGLSPGFILHKPSRVRLYPTIGATLQDWDLTGKTKFGYGGFAGLDLLRSFGNLDVGLMARYRLVRVRIFGEESVSSGLAGLFVGWHF